MTRWQSSDTDTVIRWHRAGFRSYWRWKSASRDPSSRISYAIDRRDLPAVEEPKPKPTKIRTVSYEAAIAVVQTHAVV